MNRNETKNLSTSIYFEIKYFSDKHESFNEKKWYEMYEYLKLTNATRPSNASNSQSAFSDMHRIFR